MILQIQDHLENGGAARAASRWSDLLVSDGRTTHPVAGDRAAKGGSLLTAKPPRGLGRITEYFTGRGRRKSRVETQFQALLQMLRPKLIWVHNIAGGEKWGWSEKLILTARQHAPVLWTLHDMWALGDSSKAYWQEDSFVEGERGQEARSDGLKGSRVERVCREDKKYPVTVTAPSRWLADLTKKTTGQDCVFLPNPIDLKTFSPGDRIAARRRFGLPEEGLVVLAGADSLADPRKGFDLLHAAWPSVRGKGATLALFGRHGEKRPDEKYLGNLTSDEEMVAAYRAADLYVHPARLDNAPCTIQESLACGTPVLAFAVGGIPEMIHPDETGYLAKKVDAFSLQEALQNALENGLQIGFMRTACRTYALKNYDSQLLKNLFSRLILMLKT